MDDPRHSLRRRFYKLKVLKDTALRERVRLAEDAFKWPKVEVVFGDLLELEEYLAGLSSRIFLLVEGPGAIAELGAFSQMPILREKLTAVVERSHFRQQSFIRNGPIENMRRKKVGRVLSYRWLVDGKGSRARRIDPVALDVTLDALVKEFRKALKTRRSPAQFRADDHGHRMLLIADLIKLHVISIRSELQSMLAGLDKGFEKWPIARYLYLLAHLDLISAETHGRLEYYFSAKGAPNYIWYAPRSPADRFELQRRLRNDFPLSADAKDAMKAFGLSPLGVA